MAAKTSVEWVSVLDRLPDDAITVLVHSPTASEPVWLAYFDAEQLLWRWVSGEVVEELVAHWMELPEPPTK